MYGKAVGSRRVRMAELTISVGRDPDSGRTFIRVALRSDADSSAHEHEDHHRRLVARLFPSDAEVRRERPAREAAVG
jgi:hypothetical protein